LNGLKAELPILLGVLPFGMIYGVLALQRACRGPGFGDVVDRVRARRNSSHAVDGAGAGGVVIIATTFVVNLRHALYRRQWRRLSSTCPCAWKVLLAYLLTDEA